MLDILYNNNDVIILYAFKLKIGTHLTKVRDVMTFYICL